LYYKLEPLKKLGIDIHLHCIQYGNNQPQAILEKVCSQVSYYKRKKIFPIRFWGLPYIVESRIISQLINKLNQDDAPILIEGIHGTGILPHLKKKERKCIVRICNTEFIYYKNLVKTSRFSIKKLYYWSESIRLHKWENALVRQGFQFCSIAQLDLKIYQQQLRCKKISYIPLFIPPWPFSSLIGKGKFCLYHGNLDVTENQEAIKWLIEEVYTVTQYPLYIAGKSNGAFVNKMRTKNTNVRWIENPTELAMQQLIADAHIHLLPSFNATGIKLKLLNALYNGRFCLVNEATIKDSGLEQLCTVANTKEAFREKIGELYYKTFTQEAIDLRKSVLEKIYNNNKNAILLKQELFGE